MEQVVRPSLMGKPLDDSSVEESHIEYSEAESGTGKQAIDIISSYKGENFTGDVLNDTEGLQDTEGSREVFIELQKAQLCNSL